MAQLIARIELQGSPTSETYDKLHALMEERQWARTIGSSVGVISLPHAMYQVASDKNVSQLATNIHEQIKKQVWTKPIVLIMDVGNWSMMP